MPSRFFPLRQHYSPLPLTNTSDENIDDEIPNPNPEKQPWYRNPHHHPASSLSLPIQALVAILLATTLLAGGLGFGIGALVFRNGNSRSSATAAAAAAQKAGTVPRVPIGHTVQIFQYNESFAAPPPEHGGAEPIWDSLIPNGLGYISPHSPLSAPNASLSVISAFHQLHCLYTLRRAYYSPNPNGSGGGEDFDFGLDRTMHAGHCFEYLRQSLMCAADSTVEPAEVDAGGFLGWGFGRWCGDFGELGAWAERWRAFEGRGFLARPGMGDEGGV